MKAIRVIGLCLFLGWAVPVAPAWAQPGSNEAASAVYVCDEKPDACLELATNGLYYLRTWVGRFQSGTWSNAGGAVLLGGRVEWPTRLAGSGDLLRDEESRTWRRCEAGEGKPGRSPVEVRVVDDDDDAPVRDFNFEYWMESGDRQEYSPHARPRRVVSRDGAVSISAPESCELTVCISAPDYVNAFGNWATFAVGPDAGERSFEIRLNRGMKVAGKVTDVETGKPVSGAGVAPLVFESPAVAPDVEREARTDESGEYELRGVDPALGVRVFHPLYVETRVEELDGKARRAGASGMKLDIAVKKGAVIAGTVRGPDGNPLKGVKISDGSGHEVFSAEDGRFSIGGIRDTGENGGDGCALSFCLPGYIPQTVPAGDSKAELKVALEHLYEVRGRVLGLRGEPVCNGWVVVGAGEDPAAGDCVLAAIASPGGDFTVRLERGGTNWFGVKTHGHAFWEARINVIRGMDPLVIRLSAGSTVRGAAPVGDTNCLYRKAFLVPQWRMNGSEADMDESALRRFGRTEAVVGADGRFEFRNVASGAYGLMVNGGAAMPLEYIVAVREGTVVDAGSLARPGFGTVRGRICLPPDEGSGGWAFVEGTILSYSPSDVVRSFKTDGDGWFEARDIPAGMAWLGLPDDAGSGVRRSHGCALRVAEGRETGIELYEQEKNARVDFRVLAGPGGGSNMCLFVENPAGDEGDGWVEESGEESAGISAPRFRLSMEPAGPEPARIPDAAEGRMESGDFKVAVEDVPPGKYRARLDVGLSLPAVTVWEKDVVVAATGACRVEIVLGQGAVRGNIGAGEGGGVDDAVACAIGPGNEIRYALWDGNGEFCVPFVPAGNWTVMAKSGTGGWGKIDGVKVGGNAVDVGKMRLEKGVNVGGSLWATLERRCREYAITAVDEKGIEVPHPGPTGGFNGEQYEFRNLWPGRWTIKLTGDGRELRSVAVEAHGGSVKAELGGN